MGEFKVFLRVRVLRTGLEVRSDFRPDAEAVFPASAKGYCDQRVPSAVPMVKESDAAHAFVSP
ncbi:MAG: hypothetical protein LBT47_09505 [Deltaproteobacteria bacterium]|nr:hypothetical protein [Deltaproteobacteria bacterium]